MKASKRPKLAGFLGLEADEEASKMDGDVPLDAIMHWLLEPDDLQGGHWHRLQGAQARYHKCSSTWKMSIILLNISPEGSLGSPPAGPGLSSAALLQEGLRGCLSPNRESAPIA